MEPNKNQPPNPPDVRVAPVVAPQMGGRGLFVLTRLRALERQSYGKLEAIEGGVGKDDCRPV